VCVPRLTGTTRSRAPTVASSPPWSSGPTARLVSRPPRTRPDPRLRSCLDVWYVSLISKQLTNSEVIMTSTTAPTAAPARGTIVRIDPFNTDWIAYQDGITRMYIQEVNPGKLYRVFKETGWAPYPH